MARDPSDREWEQEHHQRRMELMRVQGDIIKQERRYEIGFVIAGILALLVILLMSVS